MTVNIDVISRTGMQMPNADYWHPAGVVDDMLGYLNDLRRTGQCGPFTVVFSGDWKPFLQDKYILSGGMRVKQTLKERLESIEGIVSVEWRYTLAGPFVVEINNHDGDPVLRGSFDIVENFDD